MRRLSLLVAVILLMFVFRIAAAPLYSTGSFDERVSEWAVEISASTPEAKSGGNCLPVAMKLRDRIWDSGRIAVVIGNNPDPTTQRGHAMVMYDSDKDGLFDSVIDNGFLTSFVPQTHEKLFDGSYGEYWGVCKEPDAEKGLCTFVSSR